MTIYRVMVGKSEYKVEVSDRQVRVNGEPTQADLTPLNGGGLYLLRRGNCKRELHVLPQGKSMYGVLASGRYVIAQVQKELGLNHNRLDSHQAGDLVAPMPGLVVSIAAQAGQTVKAGQPLLVLESMKMQMDIRAPISGRVEKVMVHPGDQVEKGALLIKLVEI